MSPYSAANLLAVTMAEIAKQTNASTSSDQRKESLP